MKKSEQIISLLKEKGKLKQQVFDNTFETFNELKKNLLELEKEYNKELEGQDSRVRLEYSKSRFSIYIFRNN